MPRPVPYQEQLLEHAESLLAHDAREPSQADLRRSASTAYYALFHFLADEAGAHIVGRANRDRPLRAAVARALDHGMLRSVFERLNGDAAPGNLPAPLKPCLTAVSPPLREVATQFAWLQDMRHRADYDRLLPLAKPDSEDALSKARSAIGQWHHVPSTERTVVFLGALAWRTLSGR